jgi:hypothetical protein
MASRINVSEALNRFRERVVRIKQAGLVTEAMEEIIDYHLEALASVPIAPTTTDSATAATTSMPLATAADVGFQRKCAILRRMIAAGLKTDKLLIVIAALNFDDVGRMTDDALEGLFPRLMMKMGPTKCAPISQFAARRVRM